MFIRKVRLQNIKSYTDQTILFHEGVNFISGVNGAGKSTIIESIGYALFDYNPYPNVRDLIRYGAKSGTITVDFCANDEREYRVVRKIGTSSLWAVYDLESGSELGLHGARDVREWLKEAMGVDRDISLDQLFQDIVGVPQGTFVAPFLETQAVRKKKFDAILKVEQYREAFNNTGQAQSLLKKRIDTMETDLKIMAERVREYDTTERELAALREKVGLLEAKVKELADRISKAEKEAAALEEIRTRLEKQEGDLKALEATGAALQARLADLARDLTKAEEALNLVNRAKAGYKEFIALEGQLRTLEAKRIEKQKLEKELNRLQQEIAGTEAQVREKEKNLNQQQKDTAQEKEAASAKLEEIAVLLREAGEELRQTKNRQAKAAAWRDAEERLKLLAGRLEKTAIDAAAKLEQLNQLCAEEKTLQESLSRWDEIEKKSLSYNDLDTALQNTRNEYAVAASRLKTLEKNLEETKGGLCPFLQSPCQNVGGNLEEYFARQIEATRQELISLTEKGKSLKFKRDEAEKAQKELIKLQGDKNRLLEVTARKEKITAETGNLLAAAGEEPLNKVLDELAFASGLDFADCAEGFAVYLQPDTDIQRKYDNLKNFLSLLESTVTESREQRESFEKEVTEELNARSNQVAKLEADQRNTLGLLDRLAERENKIRSEWDKLAATRAGISGMQEKVMEVKASLAGYIDLEEKIEACRKQQDLHRQDYEIYMQNIGEAGKVENIRAAKEKASGDLEENTAALLKLREEQERLKKSFNPDEYAAKKAELDKLRQEEATEKQVLLERKSDLKELEDRIAEMKKTMEEMAALEKDTKNLRRTLDLLETVRTILNNAGPPIARVFLENLSRTANELYRQVSRENAELQWREGYEIVLVDNVNGQKRERTFKQFSGGEQTTAALAVRLALLKQQSGVRVGFFDEPTSNLDSDRRVNLAETIPQVTGGFSQIFIISHDDTFDAMTDNVIHIQKDHETGSQLAEE